MDPECERECESKCDESTWLETWRAGEVILGGDEGERLARAGRRRHAEEVRGERGQPRGGRSHQHCEHLLSRAIRGQYSMLLRDMPASAVH